MTVWEPYRELEFELYDCTLPVRRLRHHYTLTPEGAGTRVDQKQDYELKFGPLGGCSTSSRSAASGTRGLRASLLD